MNGLRIIQALCPPPPRVCYTIQVEDAYGTPLDAGEATLSVQHQPADNGDVALRITVGDELHERIFEFLGGEEFGGWVEAIYYPGTYLDPPEWDARDMSALEVIAVLAGYNVPTSEFVPVMDMILSTEGSLA